MYDYSNYQTPTNNDPKYKIGQEVFYVQDGDAGQKMIHTGHVFVIHMAKNFKNGFNYSYSIKSLTQVQVLDEEKIYQYQSHALSDAKRENGDIDEVGS